MGLKIWFLEKICLLRISINYIDRLSKVFLVEVHVGSIEEEAGICSTFSKNLNRLLRNRESLMSD